MTSPFRKPKSSSTVLLQRLATVVLWITLGVFLGRTLSWFNSELTLFLEGGVASTSGSRSGKTELPLESRNPSPSSPAVPRSSSSALPASIPAAIARANASVVVITYPGEDAETTDHRGSGVIVDARKGLILTARHVILGIRRDFGDSDTLLIRTSDKRDLTAKVLKINNESSGSGGASGSFRARPPGFGPMSGGPRQGNSASSFKDDMALLQIVNPPANLVAAPLSTSSNLAPGTEAWTIGAPGCSFVSTPENCDPPQFRKTQVIDPPDAQLKGLVVVQGGINPKTGQEAAPGMPGASGGGLFNDKGELTGIVVMGNSPDEMSMPISDQFAGSVPIETIRSFL